MCFLAAAREPATYREPILFISPFGFFALQVDRGLSFSCVQLFVLCSIVSTVSTVSTVFHCLQWGLHWGSFLSPELANKKGVRGD